MDEKKMFNYVSFAIKSGEVVFGIDNIKTAKVKPTCIILSKNASQNLKDSVLRFCEDKNVPYINLQEYEIDQLAHTTNCKVIGITNINIAKQVLYLKNQ